MIARIKDSVSIQQVLALLNIKIVKKGNRLWANCPLHKENTPSFLIDKSRFICFGCNVHGDVFTLYESMYDISFIQAARRIISDFNLDIKVNYKDYKKEYEILLKASEHYSANVGMIKDYLEKRNILHDTTDVFKIGYADSNNVVRALLSKGYDFEILKNLGIVSQGSMDFIRNRMVFPLINRSNNILGFAGRSLDGSLPKYLHCKNTVLFSKSDYLYGEHLLTSKCRTSIMVEGYMDVISLHQLGIDNAVATLGTNISKQQIQKVLQYSNNLYILFDQDEAGQKAIERSSELLLSSLTSKCNIYVCNWKGFKDIDEYIKQNKCDKIHIQELLHNQSIYIVDWLINRNHTIIIDEIRYVPKRDQEAAIKRKRFYFISKILKMIQDIKVRKFYQQDIDINTTISKTKTAKLSVYYERRLIFLLLYDTNLITRFDTELSEIVFHNDNLELIRTTIVTGLLGHIDISDIVKSIRSHSSFELNILKNIDIPKYLLNSYEFLVSYAQILISLISSKNISKL